MNADIAGSELFKKVYVAEYDQFGGHPFGGIIGLYDFANTRKDILWLKRGKAATASHYPFVGSVSPKFWLRRCRRNEHALYWRHDGYAEVPAWNVF